MGFAVCQPGRCKPARELPPMIAVSEGRSAGLQGWLKSLGGWNIGSLAVWVVIFLGLAIRTLANPNRATAFTVYRLAGIHWLNAQHLYGDWRGFVYSPLAAVFFTPFGLLPTGWGNLCWTWLNAAIFLFGVYALLSSENDPGLKSRYHGIIYLLLVPLVLGNLDTGQANPTVIGLVLLAVAAVPAERWSLAAPWVNAAT